MSSGYVGLPLVVAGFLAMMFLAGALALAKAQSDEETANRVMIVLASGGLAAAALFGIMLITQFFAELFKAAATLSLP